MVCKKLSVCLGVLLAFNTMAQLSPKRIWSDGKTLSITSLDTILLPAAHNNLVFDFEQLTDSTLYFYRLLPLSNQWTQSLYPSAHYQDLSGNDYTFEIYAQTAQQKTPVKQIKFRVEDAFWEETWFLPSIAVYILLIIGIGLYLFFLYDFRQKLKMQHVRNQIASDLHDEVGSNLNSIAIFVELLRKKVAQENPTLLPILDRITSNSEETVSLMRDTVWAINPDNDSTEKLVEKMRSFGVQVLSAKGIPFDFQANIDLKKNDFQMEQRRQVYLIYKEAINNIAKHAQATKASCHITQQPRQVQIEISDNGIGFDPTKTFEGNGLKNFQLRSQEEDIQVEIQTATDAGTKIIVTIQA